MYTYKMMSLLGKEKFSIRNIIKKVIKVLIISLIVVFIISAIYYRYSINKDRQEAVNIVKGLLDSSEHTYRLCKFGLNFHIVIVDEVAPFLVEDSNISLIYTPFHNFEEAKKLLPDLPSLL